MKIFNHVYTSREELDEFFRQFSSLSYLDVLIQVFSGLKDTKAVLDILEQIAKAVPGAKIIGSSTAGEIIGGKMTEDRFVISCAVFEVSSVRTAHSREITFETGNQLAESLLSPEARAMVCFTEGLKNDPDPFIRGLSLTDFPVILAGGNAGDNNRFKSTYIIEGTNIYETGAVVAVISGLGLKAHNACSLNWLPMGREFIITRADKNRIYELDHLPIKEICRRYLGDDIVRDLPESIIEFPLIKTDGNLLVTRSILCVHEDGSFQFAGGLNKGDRVRFGVGNIDAFCEGAVKLQEEVASHPAEAIFVYTCTVKKKFLQSQLETEYRLLDKIAPVAGFTTYGEYFQSDRGARVLNIATTVLILSENDRRKPYNKEKIELKNSTIKTLTHLINTTEQEFEKHVAFLNQYRKAVDESNIISKTDPAGIITYANDRFCEISLYSREELIGSSHNIIRHPDMPARAFKIMWETITKGEIWRGIIKNRKKNGESYYADSTIIPILDREGRITEYIASRYDITRIIEMSRRIQRQTTDEMTGLPNRTQLLEDIRTTRDAGLILIDLDNFSTVNELYGISVGDNIIIRVAKRLWEYLKDNTVKLYRMPNDVFAVLDSERTCEQRVDMATDLAQRVQQKFLMDEAEIHLSCTCGIAFGGPDLIFPHAEIALRKAKEKQVPLVQFEESLLKPQFHKLNFLWLKELKDAFHFNRIIPFFQPIINNRTRETGKYESLARLAKIDGTFVSPFYFLDIAKKSKLYPELTRTMIKKSVNVLLETSHEISINLCVEDILNKDTIEFLFTTLEQKGVGNRIVLEITESEGFENMDEILALTSRIKKLGGKIAIDDFGTGYSNFSYLLKLKPDYIKIDGSIIKNIDTDPSSLAIAETIVAFTKKLGIQTIAEFVHSEPVLSRVKELDIDFSQGFFLGEPVAARQILSAESSYPISISTCFPH